MGLYVSPYKNFRQTVQHREPIRWNATGSQVLEWQRELAANFGKLGDEQPVFNPLTGEMTLVQDIQTGVYDTELAQQTEGWTDEERLMVEAKLDEISATIPAYVQKLLPVHVAAPAPWQSYDSTDAKKIVGLASDLGLVPEALRYERENRDREEVTVDLLKLMGPGDDARAKPLEEIHVTSPKPDLRVRKAPRMTDSGIVVDTPGLELKQAVGGRTEL